jgi:hypothetical protein
MDAKWITRLKRPRGGYTDITIKWFLTHLRANIVKLTNKQKALMKKEIEIEWDHTQECVEYFTSMEDKQMKLKRWGITIEMEDMVTVAVNQMQDSSIFDHKFLRQWEEKSDVDKTWVNMTDYYKAEY